MRLARILLSPYGSHERTELAFGGAGTLDVVYGPNEAGKSTLRRAIIGLFFGIDERTTDAHRFPGKDLRITADVVLDGDTRTVTRKKGRKTTLVDAAGVPVDDATWDRALGGVTRESYERAFGLDHELLRRGAEALLSGDADLGESLLSASTGAVNLGRFRESLRERADAIYSDKAKKKALNEAITTYNAKKRDVSDLVTSSEIYLGQKRALAEAEAARAVAQKRRTELLVEKQRAERVVALGHLFSQRRVILGHLAAIGDVPHVTDEAARSRAVAAHSLTTSELAIASHEAEVQALSTEVAALQERRNAHEPLLHVDAEEFLTRRVDVSRDRQEHARKEAELLDVRAKMKALLATVVGRRPTLSLTELSAAATQLSVLGEERSRRAFQADQERVQLTRIDAELAEVSDLGPARSPEARTALDVALRAAQEVLERSRELPRARAAASALREELASLPKVPDGAVLPDEAALAELAELRASLLRTRADAERELATLRERAARIDTELGALEAAFAPPSEAELLEARAARDALLSPARGLDERIPALREAITTTDALADRMRRESERVAQRARLTAEKEASQTQAAAATRALERVERELSEVLARHRALFPSMDAPEPASASAFVRDATKQRVLRARLASDEAAIDALEKEEAAAARALASALSTETGSLRALVDAAKEELAAAESASRVQKEREKHRAGMRRERAERAATLATLTEDEKVAQGKLDALLAELALPRDSSAEVALRKAHALRDIAEQEEEARKLERDLALIAERIAAQDAATAELFQALSLPPEPSGERRAQKIAELLRELDRVQKSLEQAQGKLAGTRARLGTAVLERDAAKATLDAAAAHLGAKSHAELDVLEERSRERAKLLSERDAFDLRIGEAGGDPAQPVDEDARDAAAARLPTIDDELARVDAALSQADRSIGGLAEGLRVYERAESGIILTQQAEAEQELARITDLALRYARLVLTGMRLDERIAAHRAENENDVLAHASSLVAKITGGSITALTPSYEDEEHPVLVCVRQDGKETPVAGLSDGAKDALYLSLRIASITKLARRGQALPVLLDDVLIHMDDDRAKVAVTALADLAKETQVLFFTHHRRMVEICESVIPKAVLRVTTI